MKENKSESCRTERERDMKLPTLKYKFDPKNISCIETQYKNEMRLLKPED